MLSLLSLGTLLLGATALPIPGFLLEEPAKDPFYDAPSNLDSLANGEVYDAREVFNSIFVDATLAQVEQVAYKTLNTQNQSSHSVVTVISPLIKSEKARILSYQTYEDAANINCSPSYELATDLTGWGIDITIAILTAISNGYYIFIPDHEGIRSGFIAGYEQGQAGLDGVRAGINYLGLDQDTPVALQGYSGGASATVWMASLAEAYAPELNIVGAAHGGTPIDMGEMVKFLDKQESLFSGFIVPAIAGLLNSYPHLEEDFYSHADEDFRNALTKTRTPGFCFADNIFTFQHQEWHTKMDIDIFTYPSTVSMLRNETLLSNVSSTPVPVPKFPRYIYHAEGDEIVPFYPVKQYVNEQCALGANIQFVTWYGNDHESVQYLGLLGALRFSLQALEGTTPQVQCGTANDDILTWLSTDIAGILGDQVANVIKGVSYITTPLGKIISDFTEGYAS